MKKYFILSGVCSLLLVLGCSPRQNEVEKVKHVKTDTVHVYGESVTTTFTGKVLAASDMNLAFRVSGPIVRVNVEVGSFVRKGDVLAQIDPRDYEIQLAATEAEYRQIRSEAERVIELFEKQSVAPNDRDRAVYGLQQITAKYEAHKNALADTRLLAPCDGFIQKRLFEPGETVNAGLPVLSMIGSGTGEVEINIPSSEYIRRDRFDRFSCTVDIFPDRFFPLELIGITRKANVNQLYTMRFRLTGEEKALPQAGMSTMVTITYKPEESGLVMVPLTSVFESSGGATVWLYDEASQTVRSCAVKVSQILTGGTAVISSGLQPGEVVVSAGVHSLKEGETVKRLPPVSPTNIGGML